jgi:hypothetical protein
LGHGHGRSGTGNTKRAAGGVNLALNHVLLGLRLGGGFVSVQSHHGLDPLRHPVVPRLENGAKKQLTDKPKRYIP